MNDRGGPSDDGDGRNSGAGAAGRDRRASGDGYDGDGRKGPAAITGTAGVAAGPTARRTRRVRMTGTERREQLLAIGRTLFAERGYEGTSVEEIAHQAGVSKPVVYEHFGGKEGLYAVVVDRETQRLLDMVTGALTGGHPRELLEEAAFALLDYIEQSTDGFRILVRDSPVAQSTGTFASLISDIATQVEDILGHEFEQRGFDAGLAPSTPRRWSAWWPSPASGGSTPGTPGKRTSSPTWSTSPGTACQAWSRARG